MGEILLEGKGCLFGTCSGLSLPLVIRFFGEYAFLSYKSLKYKSFSTMRYIFLHVY